MVIGKSNKTVIVIYILGGQIKICFLKDFKIFKDIIYPSYTYFK